MGRYLLILILSTQCSLVTVLIGQSGSRVGGHMRTRPWWEVDHVVLPWDQTVKQFDQSPCLLRQTCCDPPSDLIRTPVSVGSAGRMTCLRMIWFDPIIWGHRFLVWILSIVFNFHGTHYGHIAIYFQLIQFYTTIHDDPVHAENAKKERAPSCQCYCPTNIFTFLSVGNQTRCC